MLSKDSYVYDVSCDVNTSAVVVLVTLVLIVNTITTKTGKKEGETTSISELHGL